MVQVPAADMPPDALEKAQAAVEALREQLKDLFVSIPPGHEIATRFSAGDEE